MPRDDVAALVSAIPLPAIGAPPPVVDRLSVREIGATTDCGCVERRVLAAWFYGGAAPVRRFALFLRRADDEAWEHVGYAIEQSKVLCCSLGLGVDYVLAVVAESPDGAHLPVGAATSLEFRLYGLEELPPAPENLRLYRVDDAVVLAWDAVEYPAPVRYEVRVGGANWAGARHELLTGSTWVALERVFPGADVTPALPLTYSVAPVTATGLRGEAAQLLDQEPTGPPDQVVTAASHSGAWTGTKTGCEVSAGDLVVSAGQVAATYQHGTLDTGALDEYVILAGVRASIENVGLTLGTGVFSLASAEAGRRSIDGGESAEWFPTDGIEWPESPRLSDAGDETLAASNYTLDSFAWDRDPDDPDDARIEDFDVALDSPFGAAWTLEGPVSSAGTGYALEIATSADDVTYTAWKPWRPESSTFRYLRWRLVITQPAPARTVTFDRVVVAAVRPRGVAPGSAPNDAQYLVGAANGSLTAERVVTDTASITWDLGTPAQAKASVVFGTTSTTSCVGNDARLSDARPPSASAGGAPFDLAYTELLGLRVKNYSTAGLPTPSGIGALAFDTTTNHLKVWK